MPVFLTDGSFCGTKKARGEDPSDFLVPQKEPEVKKTQAFFMVECPNINFPTEEVLKTLFLTDFC